MDKVDLWVWEDNKSPKETPKSYACSLETIRQGRSVRKAWEGERNASWHGLVLYAIAEGLERFRLNAEVTIRSSNKWVLDRIDQNLEEWEKNGFKTKKGEEIKNADLWKRIAKRRHMLLIRTKYMGAEDSVELMRHTINWGKEG